MKPILLLNLLLPLLLSPLLLGVINRVKSFFSGRVGPPLLQLYFDLWKLMRKDFTYSRTTTWIFRVAPLIGLVGSLGGLLFLPMGTSGAILSFSGDFLVLLYFLGLGRFFAVIAALDTGSSFEGMGASREVQYSALIEPALFAGLAALACTSHRWILTEIVLSSNLSLWMGATPQVLLVIVSVFILLLAENCRIPFDDPNTHLELTMIHEVMVLDYGSVDLAAVLYSASLKLWVFASLLSSLLLPHTGTPGTLFAMGVTTAGVFGIAMTVGIVESIIARLRLVQVPQLLIGAGALSVLALLFSLKGTP